jgi:hypothetical protein
MAEPQLEHRNYAELGAQPLGIGRDRKRGLGRSLEQNIVDCRLVLIGQPGDGARHSIDEMEIGRRQKLGFAVSQPFPRRCPLALGAMTVAARVVGNGGV